MLTREFVGRTAGQNWHYIYRGCKGVPFMWHYHPEFELTLTLGAQGTRYIGSDVAQFDEIDLALVAPNQAHTWHACTPPENTRVQVIFFTPGWLNKLVENGLPELSGFTQWLGAVREGVVFSPACVQEVLSAFNSLHYQRDMARFATLVGIFEALVRDQDARHIGNLARAHGPDHRLDAALDFLYANYLRPVSLEAVAEAASASPSTIKRLFRSHLRVCMSELLVRLRLGHACYLLVSTGKSIGYIASASGFSNPGHFFAMFRQRHGMTPSEFRSTYHLTKRAGQAPAGQDLQFPPAPRAQPQSSTPFAG